MLTIAQSSSDGFEYGRLELTSDHTPDFDLRDLHAVVFPVDHAHRPMTMITYETLQCQPFVLCEVEAHLTENRCLRAVIRVAALARLHDHLSLALLLGSLTPGSVLSSIAQFRVSNVTTSPPPEAPVVQHFRLATTTLLEADPLVVLPRRRDHKRRVLCADSPRVVTGDSPKKSCVVREDLSAALLLPRKL